MNNKEIKIPDNIIDYISINNPNIYCELSGGYHSSTIALLLFELGFKNVELIFCQTYLENNFTLENISSIQSITNYSLITLYPNFTKKYPNMLKLMRYCFSNIDFLRKQPGNEKNKNYRDYFPCCKILKKYPMNKLHKQIPKKHLIFSGLTPFESFNRYVRLKELRNKNTYFRNLKVQKVLKCYPYRDLLIGNRNTSRQYYDKLFEDFLRKYNLNIIHSGCKICPIRVLFPKMLNKNDCSLNYYNKLKEVNKNEE